MIHHNSSKNHPTPSTYFTSHLPGIFQLSQVFPVAARTGAYFVSQLGFTATGNWLREDVAQRLPSVSFAPEVVAFLQSVTLILAPGKHRGGAPTVERGMGRP